MKVTDALSMSFFQISDKWYLFAYMVTYVTPKQKFGMFRNVQKFGQKSLQVEFKLEKGFQKNQ